MPKRQDSKTKVAGAHIEASPSSTLQAYKTRVWNMPQTREILKGSENLDVYTQKTPRVVENISSLHPNTEVLNALALALLS